MKHLTLTVLALTACTGSSGLVPEPSRTMQIRDLTVADIRAGHNWRLVEPDSSFDENRPMEEWRIQAASRFTEDDEIVYSALWVTDGGIVTPLVVIKRVGDLDYWGDSCEWIDGRWRQVGLTPNPSAPPGQEYVANPLPQDPSFDAPDHDYRAEHRAGFRRWATNLGD
jgi:hypothetical protein